MLKHTLSFNRNERDAFIALVKIYSMEPSPPADRARYKDLIKKFEDGGSLDASDVFVLRMAIEHSSQELRAKLN